MGKVISGILNYFLKNNEKPPQIIVKIVKNVNKNYIYNQPKERRKRK